MNDVSGDSNSITINAPISKAWEVLTTPELIKQWFYGVDTETDWQVGSPIIHRGDWQGRPYEDKGTILEFEPPRTLVHTHWSAFSGLPDSAENYQTVTWTLTERDGATELTVTEDKFPSEEAKTLSKEIWANVLKTLKELLE